MWSRRCFSSHGAAWTTYRLRRAGACGCTASPVTRCPISSALSAGASGWLNACAGNCRLRYRACPRRPRRWRRFGRRSAVSGQRLRRFCALPAGRSSRRARSPPCSGSARSRRAAGVFEGALELLALAEASTLDELQTAHVELLRGQIAFASSMGTSAPPLLLEAAQRLERLDLELARETYLDAWGAALFAGRFASAGNLLEVSHAAMLARRPARPCVHPTCCSTASPPLSPKDVRRPGHC